MKIDRTKEHNLNFRITREHRITFLTGAGISADSGIPTFRGKSGLWEKVDIDKVATPEGFAENPKLAWEWYDSRRVIMKDCKPNRAHDIITKLEQKGYDVVVITQNIDNLHRDSGTKNIIELHGNIWYVRCTRGCGVWEDRTAPMPSLPPICACGAIVRPHVVWFGEMLDVSIVSAAYQRLFKTDVCVVVGTSGVVYPAAGFAEIAKGNGAYVIEVNLEQTPISAYADESHFGRASVVLPSLFKEYLNINQK